VVSYSVSPALPTGLALNTTTGILSGTPTAVTAAASYTVTATNTAGSTTASLTITVNAAVLAPTGLTYSTNPAVYTNGVAIPSNTPSSGGGAVVSYSVSPALPAGLALNTTTGIVSGTPTAVKAVASYTVTATNTAGSTTASLTITVNAAVVAPTGLTYSTNPAFYTNGVAIPSNAPSSGGGAVVSYSVSPALPTGLALNTTTGIVSGTPTAVTAAASYTVTATNTAGSTTASLTITVNAAVVAPTGLTYSTNPAVYTNGVAIPSNTPSSGGGAVTSYGVNPALPTGLNLNSASGVITGTPTAVTATGTYTVTATNSAGFTTVGLTITVNASVTLPTGLTYTVNPAVYTAGLLISPNTPSSSGGAVASYSVSPALPSGLALNTTTGVITGTPTAVTATGTYTITATNNAGFTTVGLTITAIAKPVITSFTATANPITVGTSTRLIAVFSGGTGSIDNGIGAVTSGTQVLTGLLTSTTTFTLTVTNTAGGSVTSIISVTTVAIPVITSFAPSSDTISSGTSPTLTAIFSGGTGTYMYWYQSTLSPSHSIISGTPNTSFVLTALTTTIYNFRLTVVSASGYTVEQITTVTVIPTPVITSFSASKYSITNGNGTILAYSFSGGIGNIDQGVGTVTSGGTSNISPLGTGNTSVVYNLTVTNSVGVSVTNSLTINLYLAPQILNFYADSQSILIGTSTTLRAQYQNGTITIKNGISTLLLDSYYNSVSTGNLVNTSTFVATVKNLAGDSVTASTTVAIIPYTALTGSMDVGRSGQKAILLPNGKVLIAGGNQTNTKSTAMIYDGGTFVTLGTMAPGCATFTSTLLPSGKVLFTGPIDPLTAPNQLVAQIFDPANQLFTPTGPMATEAGNGASATLLNNNLVLLISGTSAQLYDPATDSFRLTGPPNKSRSFHTATLLPDGTVLVVGGNTNAANGNTSEIYDPSTEIFTNSGNMVTQRLFQRAILMQNGKVLITGGTWGGYSLRSAEVFDPSTGNFGELFDIGECGEYHTTTLLPNGNVLLVGGWFTGILNPQHTIQPIVEYNPVTKIISTKAFLHTSRAEHSATLLQSGQVLIVGGNNRNAGSGILLLSDAELY